MSSEEIMPKVKNFVGQYLNTDALDYDLDLFASGMVNSLFAMQLVLFVEKEYGFKVENDDLDIENFKSLNAIDAFIKRKLAITA